MNTNEKIIDYLEQHIPEMAVIATKQAYWQALGAGNTVLITENDQLVEVSPDGSRKIIRAVEPRTKAMIGQKIEINLRANEPQ
ncbi:MAG: hypothetical protein EAZ46_09905 [Runella sp.]|nr:MAG: hypothetical protein EAZ46_09905 [Runella sp.]